MRGSTRPSFRVQPIGWLRARELPALVALAQASMSHDSLRSASLDRSNHIGLCEPRLDLPLPACELVAYLHRNEQCTGLGSRHALPAALADARVPCGARVSGRTRKLGPRASNKRARPRCARLPPSRCAPRRRARHGASPSLCIARYGGGRRRVRMQARVDPGAVHINRCDLTDQARQNARNRGTSRPAPGQQEQEVLEHEATRWAERGSWAAYFPAHPPRLAAGTAHCTSAESYPIP